MGVMVAVMVEMAEVAEMEDAETEPQPSSIDVFTGYRKTLTQNS